MSQWTNGSKDGVSSRGGRQTDDGQNQEEPSSSSPCVTSREKRKRQRENKSRTKELSEEEMMDLALQLSQQEASVTALQLQRREEEDVMKAIKESMIIQARRPSLYTNEEAPSRTCSRQKLSYSNRTVVVDEDDSSSSEMQLTSRQSGEQKRKPGSSLQKKPDAVQTQDLHLVPDSPGSSDVLDPILHSPQSSDSTLIDDSQPPRSPVFPSTCCRAEVVIPRLNQDLVQSCRTSGFVLCSQDSHVSSESLCDGAKSPTFPQSSRQSGFLSEKDQGDIGGLSPEPCGSTFSSQDSLSSSVIVTSGRSPVFPRTGPSSSETGQTVRSLVVQMTEALQASRSLNKTQIPAAALSPPHQTEDVRDSPGSGVEVTTTNSDEAPLSSNMMLCWSDEDGEVTPVASPSPVFPAETEGQQAASRPTGPNCRGEHSTAQAQPISSQAAARGAGHPAPFGSTVHYYWGIPFCPRGLDPDRYTQVIVAQMEVFEKSLKMAQRNLLRKAEWGEGIQPQPEAQKENSESECVVEESENLRPQRRLRSKKRSNPADSPSAGAKEDDSEVVEEVEQRESQQEGSIGVAEAGDEMETEVPETQLSIDDDDERTEGLIVVRDVRTEVKSKEPPDIQMILLESPPAEEEKEEVMEVEAVQQTEGNSPERRSSPRGSPPCDEETQDGASPSQEVAVDVQEASVDCPICQGSFPTGQIEMHAAYCDGASADSPPGGAVPVSVKPRRKRTRRCEAGNGASGPVPSTSREHMKCFICQSAVPVQDYGRHTDLCLSRQDGTSAAKENLLSALEKTDSRLSDVRPSGSRLQYSDVIDLRNDNDGVPVEEDEEDGVGGVSSIAISNSPIRSFTPISEATDCLIDFRRPQRSKKLGRRRR